jgi:replicative superfamily II helicase
VLERVADWRRTDDFTPDSAALARARIIVATPGKWDAVSRAFAVRDFVLVTGRGHIIEAVADRIWAVWPAPRIVGLSNPFDRQQFLRTVELHTFIRGWPR